MKISPTSSIAVSYPPTTFNMPPARRARTCCELLLWFLYWLLPTLLITFLYLHFDEKYPDSRPVLLLGWLSWWCWYLGMLICVLLFFRFCLLNCDSHITSTAEKFFPEKDPLEPPLEFEDKWWFVA